MAARSVSEVTCMIIEKEGQNAADCSAEGEFLLTF